MSDLQRNKQTVRAFYTTAFNDKQPAEAVAQYVGAQYIQHNPQAPDGADAFIGLPADHAGRVLQLNAAGMQSTMTDPDRPIVRAMFALARKLG